MINCHKWRIQINEHEIRKFSLRQNPGTTFHDMVRGRRLDADENPDDDIIEDLEI